MLRLSILIAAVLAANIAAAQVYECTNARGVKEFAQFCPPGTVQQRQVTKGSESAGANPSGGASAPAPKTIEAQDVEFKKRVLERQEAETKAAQEKEKAGDFERNCIEARAQLKAVEDGMRMERIDPATGERIQFGDSERAEEADRQRRAVAQWCK
ncbi:MAG: DUF4124 domain-containing protein [Proteobacteria bacterium]|nr:DUF4124 domain-containing protein [Pseudomonadota bacterium]